MLKLVVALTFAGADYSSNAPQNFGEVMQKNLKVETIGSCSLNLFNFLLLSFIFLFFDKGVQRKLGPARGLYGHLSDYCATQAHAMEYINRPNSLYKRIFIWTLFFSTFYHSQSPS